MSIRHRTRQVDRPYVRQRRASGASGGGQGPAARLAGVAGSGLGRGSEAARPAIDRLEPRQMLFSLTITPDVAGPDGIGTIETTFGYTIPYLASPLIPATNDPESPLETFADEPLGGIGSGRVFLEEGLAVFHNINNPGANFRIIATLDNEGQVIDGTERIEARPSQGQSYRFRFLADPAGPANGARLAANEITLSFGAAQGTNQGITPEDTIVRLRLGNQIVAEFDTFAEIQAAKQGGNPSNGIGTYTFTTGNSLFPAFDEIEIISTASGNPAYEIDDVTWTLPPGNFTQIIESRIFAAIVSFTGPVGSSVQILDLYGRDMIQTTQLGVVGDVQVTLVDPDDNGIPNFNDGIGSIRFSGTDTRSLFRMIGAGLTPGYSGDAFWVEGPFGGGRPDFVPEPDDDTGYFSASFPQNFDGLYDDFEAVGFGFAFDDDGGGTGLPAVGGSVIIGSPMVRPLANYSPAGTPSGPGSVGPFDPEASLNPNQGVFILDGSSMGPINIHGALFGSSRFEGAVESINVGTLFGSITVEGDLGDLWVATDAGLWAIDPDFPTPPDDPAQKTGGQLVVGRTLGNVSVAGRSALDITVIADVSNPQNRPPLDQFVHTEREVVFPIDENADYDVPDFFATIFGANLPYDPVYFGTDVYRNDTIQAAEWIGTTGTSVRVDGDLGFGDPAVHSEDPSDVFAFAVDGTGQVVIEVFALPGLTVRIADQNGVTVASNNLPRFQADPRVVFTPNAPGVYYAIVQYTATFDAETDANAGDIYSLLFSGLAPTTFGNHMSGAGSGGVVDNATSTINLLSGNLGLFRSGMSFLSAGGQEGNPVDITNSDDAPEVLLTTRSLSLSVAKGNLYTFLTGTDVQGADLSALTTIYVSGNLGAFITGQSTLVGLSSEVGDVEAVSLEVGGSVGLVDIRGSVGESWDDGTLTQPRFLVGLRFRTGTSGVGGDVGVFRVGDDIWGPNTSIQIAPGSVMGAFLVSQDNGAAADGIYGATPRTGFFTTGVGSDVRFVDLPNIDLLGGVNSGITLRAGVPVEIIDDGGATIRISVTGGAIGVPVGFLRFVPIDGSEGVALGRIDNLDLGGRDLLIETLGTATDGRVSIGVINMINADAGSTITISGQIEVDIWRIIQSGGDAFDSFTNETPDGDLVAMDVVSLNQIDITTGSLGRTQMPAWGPRLIGPNLGMAATLTTDVGGPLGINAAAMDLDWSGGIYRPATNTTTTGGTAFLDDIGAPFDTFLDGVVVRSGSVASISVGGAVGDVILQGGAGAVLTELVVNTDNATPIGAFHGIVGSVYAANINRVEVGDGLRGDAYNAFSSGTIMADNQIIEVTAGEISGRTSNIEGRIWAANVANTVNPVGTPAIGRIFVNQGDYIDSSIGAGLLDGFWLSVLYQDEQIFTGTIDRLTGQSANFFRSEVLGSVINEMTLTDGYFDASEFNSQTDAGTISAFGYRNSTLTGTNLEYRPSLILIGGDLGSLQTQDATGDIRDTLVDVVGSITTGVTAGFITRSEFQVDNEIPALTIADSIRGSKFVFGRLVTAVVTDSIRHSEFRGNQLLSITAGDSITNSAFTASGPNGRIDVVSAINTISGSFTASGPIASITTTTGDIDAKITTTTRRGTVGTLTAGRDLILESDISRGISTLSAGRHIGSQSDPSVIRLRGNLTTLTAPNGQLYSDIRIGQDLTGVVTLGRAPNLAGNNQVGTGSIIAFGRIASVIVNGDFGGSILSYTGGIGSVAINNGSFLRGSAGSPNMIAAYDGDITSLVITGGNLYGDVYADYDLVNLQVVASADGVFGDVGVNPQRSASRAYDAFRNELPVGVAVSSSVQGPTIAAGRNIVNVGVTGGAAFESAFYAGRTIQNISIAGQVRNDNPTTGYGSSIAAGDSVVNVSIGGQARDLIVAGGVLDWGSDNRPGGIGAASDIVKSGSVGTVTIAGDGTNVLVMSGIQAGADGVYNTSDDLSALGTSTITSFSIAGVPTNVVLRSDVVVSNPQAGVVASGGGLKTDDPLTAKKNPGGVEVSGSVDFALGQGNRGTFTFSGPGRAFWNAGTRTLSLVNTTLASSVVLTATGPALTMTDINIVTADEASLGALTIVGTLAGNSNIVVDGGGTSFTADTLNTTGRIRYGGNLTSIRVNQNFRRGQFEAKDVGTVSIGGGFGDSNTALRGEATISVTNATSMDIDGPNHGDLLVAREVNLINVDGAVNSALIRVGSRLGQLTVGSLTRTRVSVGDFLGGTDASGGNAGGNTGVQAVLVRGGMFDSAIMVGGDLGTDGEIGGQRLAGDRVTSGFLGSVTINGDFEESDIVAGLLRGPDGFFGTSDDAVAAGRSTIGTITIAGNRVGSNRFTESYRIASTGTLGAVTIGGLPGRDQLNFEINQLEFQPLAIQVQDLRVTLLNQQFVATIQFNQPIDQATLDGALSIRDTRSGGNVQVFLISGEDYTLSYNPDTNSAIVVFSRDVTEQNLPVTPGRPTLGVYSFVIDEAKLRGSLTSARLDGNGDGFARGDDFNGRNIVGDAGDKLSNGTATVVDNGNVVHTVDFYAPVDLDVVLDDTAAADGLADINDPFIVRGFIGDHADQDTNYFRFGGDTDVYRITLQAGQILRLGGMTGSAQQATRSLLGSGGNVLYSQAQSNLPIPGQWDGNGGGSITRLQSATDIDPATTTFQGDFYVRTSGVYYIVIGDASSVNNTNTINNTAIVPNGLGEYTFSVEVFDDLDSGFASDTDAGDGTAVVNAPPASAFTQPGQVIIVGDYSFSLQADPLGNPIVVGSNSLGVTSVNANGVLTSTITSSIGPGGLAGVPNQIFSDIDVYHLNNRAGITPGQVVRITLRVSEAGGDLGSKSVDPTFLPTDHAGRVHFGIFDTTSATNATNGQLYFSPTDFSPNGGTPNTLIADNGSTKYGFDENGDFYVQFVAAGRPGADGQTGTNDDTPASYAIMVQGAFNTDYSLQVVTNGTGELVKNTQNIFIETRGGEINWLETGGLTSELSAFNLTALGFTGTNSNGVAVNQFVLQRIVASLEDAFDALGLDVNVSTNSAEFEFQPFSTIFLTNSVDPVNLTFATEYGYAQRSDPLNTDLEDEGVVFVSSFSSLQFTPDDSGLTALADALTAAVGRRAGELMGLRITADTPNTGNTFDLMAANSPDRLFYPGNNGSWAYLQSLRALSGIDDSDLNNDFVIGLQSSASLLERVLLRQ